MLRWRPGEIRGGALWEVSSAFNKGARARAIIIADFSRENLLLFNGPCLRLMNLLTGRFRAACAPYFFVCVLASLIPQGVRCAQVIMTRWWVFKRLEMLLRWMEMVAFFGGGIFANGSIMATVLSGMIFNVFRFSFWFGSQRKFWKENACGIHGIWTLKVLQMFEKFPTTFTI